MVIMLGQVSPELRHDIYRCSFDDSIHNLLSDDERVEKQTYTPRSTMQGQPPSLTPPDVKEEDVIKKLPETSSELVSIVPHEMTKKIFPYNTLVERKMT